MSVLRKIHLLVVSTTVFLFSMSGAYAGGDIDPELKDGSAVWEKAFKDGDTAAGGALYTEDAIFMPPNLPSVKGRSAIGETFSHEATGGMIVTLKDVESEISGDLGYKVGHYKVDAPDGTKLDKGRYVEIHKKVDGQWLMHRDIYSSIQPAVPADLASTMAAIDTFIGVWSSGEYDRLDAVVAENFKRVGPNESASADGLAGIKQFMGALRTAYPDLLVVAEKIDAYTGGGVVHWRATGTNTGPGESPPTGKAIDLTGLTTISLEDGKIVEEYVRFDLLTWMQQLGYTLQAP